MGRTVVPVTNVVLDHFYGLQRIPHPFLFEKKYFVYLKRSFFAKKPHFQSYNSKFLSLSRRMIISVSNFDRI